MKPEILFVAHRIPFPPNRGDKMRSWHILRALGRFATVHLAAFAESPAEAEQLGPLREAMDGALGEAHVEPRLQDGVRWMLRALRRGEPLAVSAFHSDEMRGFVERILATRPVGAVYAFSVQMAQYLPVRGCPRFVMDFVDVDSAKYAEYSEKGSPVWRLIYKREAARLSAFESEVAGRADLGLFVTDAEAALFRERAGPTGPVAVLPNGIDLAFYDPAAAFEPLAPHPGAPLIVFTGQMAYRPNIEGVVWFAEAVLPRIRRVHRGAQFAIVGREPASAVLRLAARPGVIVTGEVADVRPWLNAADVVVAPLAIARGVQNKVLEAMAMGRPVVASTGAFQGIDAEPGRDLLVADGAAGQAEAILTLLDDRARAGAMGQAGRRRMIEAYSWDAQLAPLAEMVGLTERIAA